MKPGRARAVHMQFSLRDFPWWVRVQLVLGGTVHFLIERAGNRDFLKFNVTGVRCTLGPPVNTP